MGKKVSPELAVTIRRLRSRRWTIRAIAKELNLSTTTVQFYLGYKLKAYGFR